MARLKIDRDKCIGCGSCVSLYPEVFKMVASKAEVKKNVEVSEKKVAEMISVCPVEAIIEEKKNE